MHVAGGKSWAFRCWVIVAVMRVVAEAAARADRDLVIDFLDAVDLVGAASSPSRQDSLGTLPVMSTRA